MERAGVGTMIGGAALAATGVVIALTAPGRQRGISELRLRSQVTGSAGAFHVSGRF